MGEQNVEVARRAWQAYADGGIEAAAEYFAEDCICEDFPELPDHAIYKGKEGFLTRNAQFIASWTDLVIEPIEFIDAGGDAVVVVASISGRGTGSGTPIAAGTAAFAYEIQNGEIVRDRAFTSKTQAMQAAGVRA